VLAAAVSLTWLEQSMVRSWRGAAGRGGDPDQRRRLAAGGRDDPRAAGESDFDDINAFLERETARYGVKLSPAMQGDACSRS
jgi:hypothetical protein